MSLASGDRVGSYEIVSALGAGGMGEVFRARDTRLNRDVAIKVLPAAFNLSRLSLTRLTLPRRAENPVWARDGRRIYLGYEQGKSYQIFSKAADDSGVPQLVVPSDIQEDPNPAAQPGLDVVVNWSAEVRRRVKEAATP